MSCLLDTSKCPIGINLARIRLNLKMPVYLGHIWEENGQKFGQMDEVLEITDSGYIILKDK